MKHLLMLFALALTACSAVNPVPTPTPTPVDIASLIILPGDFPEEFAVGPERDLPPLYQSLANKKGTLYRPLVNQETGEDAGMIGLFVYPDPDQAKFAYDVVLGSFDENSRPVADLGDSAHVNPFSGKLQGRLQVDLVDITFRRCTTVVHARLFDTTNEELLVAYARALDERLTPHVCPEELLTQ